MSDLSPQPSTSGQAANKKQLILVVALGAALLIALVLFVVKPFGGSDTPEASAPVAPSPAAAAAPAAPPAAHETPSLPPPPARGRDPFAPVR